MSSRSSDDGVGVDRANLGTSTPRPQPSGRRARRYGFACMRCKARKVKCSGDRPTCRHCQQSNQECCWESQTSTEAQLRRANARIRELQVSLLDERSSPRHDGTTPRPNASTETSGHLANHESNDAPEANESSASHASNVSFADESTIWHQTGIGEDGNLTYNGPTSRFHAGSINDGCVVNIDETLSRQREALRSQYDLIESVWRPLIAAKPFIKSTGVSSTVGLALLDIYWTWLHPLHNCVYRPIFMMDLALGGSYCSDFLLMCIFGLAARHLPAQSDDPLQVTNAHQFLSQAKALLLEEMSAPTPSIPTIQGLLILSGVHCALGKSSEGWLYAGMALRMMADAGLHLPLTNLVGLESRTPAEWETRRRLYNAAYIWDKTLSLALGRPPSLTTSPYPAAKILDKFDDEIIWRPVHAVEVLETFSPFRFLNSSVFCAFVSLHEISTEMLLLLGNSEAQDQLAARISDLDTRFRQWYADLPEELRLDDPAGTIHSPPPHIVSLNLLYHTLQILLRRPYLGMSDEASRDRMLSSCVKHSSAIHAIQELYSLTFPHRLMTYQVSYCIFIAAVVEITELSMGPSEQRRQEAAKRLGAALSVLQAEASHTPGSGRSLKTIRRLLAAERPSRAVPSQARREDVTADENRSHEARSNCRSGLDHSLPQGALSGHEGSLDDPMVADKDFPMNGMISGAQFDFGTGWADTSAGFHPEAFSWAALGTM